MVSYYGVEIKIVDSSSSLLVFTFFERSFLCCSSDKKGIQISSFIDCQLEAIVKLELSTQNFRFKRNHEI